MQDDELKAFFDVLHEFDTRNIDTARIYMDSEKRLGEVGASSSFIIDANAPAFAPKAHSKESIASGLDESLRLLKTDKIDVYYFHAPDPATLIEETVDTIQNMHRHGKLSRFCLSNFPPEDFEKIYSHAKSTGGVVLSVYQGNYNAFARTIDQSVPCASTTQYSILPLPDVREIGIEKLKGLLSEGVEVEYRKTLDSLEFFSGS